MRALAHDPRPAGARSLKRHRPLLRIRIGDYQVISRWMTASSWSRSLWSGRSATSTATSACDRSLSSGAASRRCASAERTGQPSGRPLTCHDEDKHWLGALGRIAGEDGKFRSSAQVRTCLGDDCKPSAKPTQVRTLDLPPKTAVQERYGVPPDA